MNKSSVIILRLVILFIACIGLSYLPEQIVSLIDSNLSPRKKIAIGGLLGTLGIYGLKSLVIDKLVELWTFIIGHDEYLLNSLKDYRGNNNVHNLIRTVNFPKCFEYFFLALTIPVGLLAGIIFINEDYGDERPSPIYALHMNDHSLILDEIEAFKYYITFEDGESELDSFTDRAQLNMLKRVILSSESCIESNEDTIGYSVLGYASDTGTPFNNIDLANERAEYVEEQIRQILLNQDELETWVGNYEIIRHKWEYSELDKMNKKKYIYENEKYSSTDLGSLSSAEFMNRRVEVSLTRLGRCEN